MSERQQGEKPVGFAALSPELRRALGQKGGQKGGGFAARPMEDRQRAGGLGGHRAQRSGTGHSWTRQEASDAGRKSAAKRVLMRTRRQAEADRQQQDA